MAEKVEVKVIDDLTGDEGASPVEFAIDGVTYEIDLTSGNAEALRNKLADYIANGRKLGKPSKVGKATASRASTSKPKIDREQSKAIREWLQRNDIPVAPRGRISEINLIAFNAGDPNLAKVGAPA
jgi:hypothetical protein